MNKNTALCFLPLFFSFFAQSTIQPPHYFLSALLSPVPQKKKKKKSMHSWSVSENTWPHNIILQAEVDYDSEIGSEAWNIPSGDFQTPTHFTGHLWVPISGTGFTWLWPLCYWCLDCCFIDFHVSMQQRRRDLRGGSDATTETCKSGLTTETLWFTDLKGSTRKGERERDIETQRERDCFIGGQRV